jgi:hypothetical protein
MAFVPSGAPVAFPPYTRALDYGLQLAFVISEPLLDAAPEQAKHFLSSLAGQAVSADELLPRWRELEGTVAVNSRILAHPHTAEARFGLGDLLAHASPGNSCSPERFSASARCPAGAAWRSVSG